MSVGRLRASIICLTVVLVLLFSGAVFAIGWVIISDGKNKNGQEKTSECRGEQATYVVEAGEIWHGTDKRDVVVVRGNGAQVYGEQGDDLICVFGNNRTDDSGFAGSLIFTGEGSNTVITYGGSNNITGGTGEDLIYLNGNIESVTAQEGHDHIWGLGATTLTAYGGSGNDLIIGSTGGDYLVGGSGDDVVYANGGDDEIVELFGNNRLFGGGGQDAIEGGADFDFCQDHDQNTTFLYCEEISQPPNADLPESS